MRIQTALLVLLVLSCAPSAPSGSGGSAPPQLASPAATAAQAPAAAAGSSASERSTAPPTPERFAYAQVVASSNDLAFFIAEQRGYYREEGVAPDVTIFQTSTDVVRALAAHSVDAGMTSPASMIVAYAKGEKDLALASGLVEKLAYPLMAARDVNTIADLRGRQIAISSLGDGLTVVTRRLLARGGLGEDDYSFVALGSTPQRTAGVEAGGVAAAVISQPFDFYLERQGFKRLGDTSEVVPEYSFIGIAASRRWMAEKPDTTARFLAAVIRAQTFMNDPANRAETLKAFQEYLSMPPEDAVAVYDLLVARVHAYPPDLTPSDNGLRAVIEVSEQLGQIDPPVPTPAELLDLAALRRAQERVRAGR